VTRIDAIIARIIEREGDVFTNDPNDSGGPTRFGITQGALSEFLGRPALVSDVMMLDRPQAVEFYWHKQVYKPKFDQIVAISEAVGAEVIDTGTLTGTPRAGMFLQRALNAMNNGGKHYADVLVDGDCGPRTREALRAFIAKRGAEGEKVLVAALNSLLGEFLIDLAERRPKDEAFLYGWLKARVLEPA
jgi:lysozyme family protein